MYLNFSNSVEFEQYSIVDLAKSLGERWQKLCRRFLPVGSEGTIWRYNRERCLTDPEQGWKLHVSATILNAADVLEVVAPFLEARKAYYKAPVSLFELKKINSGIYYDYTQIGKFITIYPRNDEDAVFLAKNLHDLTARHSSPTIPFDLEYQPQSSVFYRYGAFRIKELKLPDGKVVLAMRDEKGEFIADERDSEKPFPTWVSNPFPVKKSRTLAKTSFLDKNFCVLRALSQRGKGGVYLGLDLSANAPRVCVLKEGRKNGEVDWDGRDGYWRIKHEARVIKQLRNSGVEVPEIYSSFESENNYYVAAEYIEGENLHAFLKKRRRRLSIAQAVKFAANLAAILARIHSAGWLWRDCKPGNLIVTKQGNLRPLDFEGACLISRPDPIPWTTLATNSPELNKKLFGNKNTAVDLFALGAVFYLLLEGKTPFVQTDSTTEIHRRKVPAEIKRMIANLLEPDAAKYLDAQTVAEYLRASVNF